MYKGWTSKPTPRSDTARLNSNVFTAFGIVNGFLRASIVTMFSVMAVKPKKALKTQLAVSVALIIARMSQVTLSSVYLQLSCHNL